MMIDKTQFKTPFFVSAATGIVAVGALLTGGYALASTLLASFGGEVDAEQQVATWLERHDERMDTYASRFNGRSVFYTPTPSQRPYVPPPPPEVRDDPEPAPVVPAGPAPPPPIYNGPKLLAILGEEVWIRGSGSSNAIVRVKVGEEHEGVRLIATDPPWSAELGWSRGEYTVPLFTNSSPGITEATTTASTSTVSIPGIIDEGAVDPATLTAGIALSGAAFTPSSAGGRNVARPASSVSLESRAANSGRRGRSNNRAESDEEAKTRMAQEREQRAAEQKQREYDEWQRERQRGNRGRGDDV